MARKKISNELWKALQPLLPVVEPSTKGGRPRVDDRAALNGILFVLHTGIPWEDLPKELGFGSGMTCWRRLREWQANGVWERLHLALLKRLREHDQIDWSRASVDGATVASPGGEQTGPNPTDRGKLGSKRHLVVDRRGVPLALMVTGANRHDSVVFEVLVDAIPSVPGLDGRPRCRPDKLHADKGYDFARCRRHLRKRGMTPGSLAVASRRTTGSASIAGWSNAPMPGLLDSASCAFVSSVLFRLTSLCSPWLAPSSADDLLIGFVSDS